MRNIKNLIHRTFTESMVENELLRLRAQAAERGAEAGLFDLDEFPSLVEAELEVLAEKLFGQHPDAAALPTDGKAINSFQTVSGQLIETNGGIDSANQSNRKRSALRQAIEWIARYFRRRQTERRLRKIRAQACMNEDVSKKIAHWTARNRRIMLAIYDLHKAEAKRVVNAPNNQPVEEFLLYR